MKQSSKRFYIGLIGWLMLVLAVSYTVWEHWDLMIEREILFIVLFQYLALAMLFLGLFGLLPFGEEEQG